MSGILLNYLTEPYEKRCRICLARVNGENSDSLRAHMDKKHPDRCEYCGDIMWSDEHRKKHMLRRHPYYSKKRGL